jgi:HSP20 family protein
MRSCDQSANNPLIGSPSKKEAIMNLFKKSSWMWDEALAALDRAERHQRRFFALTEAGTRLPAWEPPVDIFETEDGLRIHVALPGVHADQVALYLQATGLVLQTERAPPPALQCVRIHRMEIPYGRFERHITLPPGRYTLQEQRMVDGCLELHLTRT